MSHLILCPTQKEPSHPYRFSGTGFRVFSIEEAVYHCFTYWKQSIDDFSSEEFIDWIGEELGLPLISAGIKEMLTMPGLKERLIGFLSLIDYLSDEQLNGLRNELTEWERRLEWERLKERADEFLLKGHATEAYGLYKKALSYSENERLYNNIGIALLKCKRYQEAAIYFQEAFDALVHGAESGNSDDGMVKTVTLNLAEALIYSREFERALTLLKRFERGKIAGADYLYGLINFETGDYRFALDYFETAYSLHDEQVYLYKIAETYVKLRQFDKAIEVFNRVKPSNNSPLYGEMLVRQAAVHIAGSNVPAAIKCVERAVIQNINDYKLWVLLARYHRMNYDLVKADSAIARAVALNPEYDEGLLEQARIKKAQGKIKDYQVTLSRMLVGLKDKYRES